MKTQLENNTQIQKLARTIMTAYSIKPDNSLTTKIGNGKESSNYEVVENWVNNFLNNPDEKLAESILPILVDKFDEVFVGGKQQ